MSQEIEGNENFSTGGSYTSQTINGQLSQEFLLEQGHKTLRKMIESARNEHSEITSQIRIRSIVNTTVAVVNMVLLCFLLTIVVLQKDFYHSVILGETKNLEHYISKELNNSSKRSDDSVARLKDRQDDRIKELLEVHMELSTAAFRELNRETTVQVLGEVKTMVDRRCGDKKEK